MKWDGICRCDVLNMDPLAEVSELDLLNFFDPEEYPLLCLGSSLGRYFLGLGFLVVGYKESNHFRK